MRLLAEDGPVTRRQLAQLSGLSIPTAASIVNELLADGYVTESPSACRSGGRGPRAGLIGIVRNGHVVVGVDVSGSRLRLGLCDLSGVVSKVVSAPVERGARPDQVLEIAVAAAAPLVRSAGERLIGFGVAVPGPVDAEARRLLLSVALGWRDVPVAERFEQAYGKVAAVEHNVRAMARGEARYGLGQRADNLLYLHLGESFGVAFLVEGLAFRQSAQAISELGHHQVAADGPECACGAVGCLEAVVAREHLLRRIGEAGRDSPVLARLAEDKLPPLEILDAAARAGADAAIDIMADFINHLSTAVALSINMFGAVRVALGGELETCPKDVFGRLRAATLVKVSRTLRDKVTIDRAALGRYPGVLGAGTVALDRLFYRDHPSAPAARGSRRRRPQWATAATAQLAVTPAG
jgi:predicted NBD/HSP70 family sugar kinase